MKIILFLLFCSFSLAVEAQVLKERRVYYLDCSFSMVSNKLWEPVRENLKLAIDKVNDETTELIVIPFADNASTKPTLRPIKALATEDGKKQIKSKIDALEINKKTMTYHYIPISDFYSLRANSDRVTYMFLMTDGQDEDPLQRTRKVLLPQWGKQFVNKNVFGFYVMLHNSAKDKKLEDVIDGQDHLWKVESADVNINLIRLQSNAIFNAKNDKYFDLPVYGDLRNMTLNAQFVGEIPYKVKKIEYKDSSIRIWIDSIKGSKMPESLHAKLKMVLKNGGKYDFLVTETISVRCDYKPERSLKISVR